MGNIQTTREHLAQQLRAYGEEVVGAKIVSLSDNDFNRIGQLAFDYACQITATGRPMMFDLALARAAVEVVEGAPRELRRKRRIYK